MAGVLWQRGTTAIVDPLTAAVAVVTVTPPWTTRLANAWYIAAGAAIGRPAPCSRDQPAGRSTPTRRLRLVSCA
ncbi:hypothetical protein [Streptosporangium vulgare]|uniref:Uncharacterized protein n=1 Tax=Streptosporangium vulgare TaxID=46190 RepID=A0ABV5TVJ6_9ACTN